MSKTMIALENVELIKNKIIQLLEQLIIDYQNCAIERAKISVNLPVFDDEFTLLEDIELLTIDIRGYGCQIKAQGYINDKLNVVNQLQKMQIFNIPNISQFYFNKELNFPLLKNYLQMLDYLRLLILEYISID